MKRGGNETGRQLVFSACDDYLNIFVPLLKHGADPNAYGSSGDTAFSLGQQEKHVDLVQLIETDGRKEQVANNGAGDTKTGDDAGDTVNEKLYAPQTLLDSVCSLPGIVYGNMRDVDPKPLCVRCLFDANV